ncbi:anaerobic ribonucleoside-triphosphate reductase activating protein [Desulfosporosinus sp. BICA1-9]|uniref:anaerobic ribonucleoside-triphosphate reductase activating protein n=1 Tax=Desulfosporosinus sp. BICA1-9 TaxID=1531958 RepID=UPI00054C091D|nr:anaerobic ribonucleoside-triphosphate reductase activating protein [Desulfosporosinus sp. BICA1-9]KJS86533.1 MAG: ribonucleoside-triphosphate reductase [Desulfosporosinus sp. BICA1-9]HBW36911.1 anaerobic ribonucleoside-triphosphate reductase activating protein [Desulfosporosinus sp.]
MNIAGFVKTSFVDYPGKIASVVFTQGCNLRCGYCHNVSLLDTNDTSNAILPEEIFEWLSKRKGMIDAVVVSGGEPTLQKNLHVFIEELKAMSLLVKLDTNGTNPDSLRALIDDKLLDFIAMDLKAPLSKYEHITGTSQLELSSIRESMEIIKNSGLEHEFRTTLCPELEADDIPSIILDFEIAANYVVQSCRSTDLKKVSRNKQDLKRLTHWTEKNLPLSFRGF